MAVFAFQPSFTTKFDAKVRIFCWDIHNFNHIGLPGGNIPILKIMPRRNCISSRFQAKQSPEMANLGRCLSYRHISEGILRFREHKIAGGGEILIHGPVGTSMTPGHIMAISRKKCISGPFIVKQSPQAIILWPYLHSN